MCEIVKAIEFKSDPCSTISWLNGLINRAKYT